MSHSIRLTALFLSLTLLSPAYGGMEIFGKASYSRTNLNSASYTQSIGGAVGMAFILVPQIRLETRYTLKHEYQNRNDLNSDLVLTNIKTQTGIYSVGLDISLFNDKSTFIPFIFVGAGYAQVTQTEDLTQFSTDTTVNIELPKRTGIAGQLGAGFRWRVAKSAALELEFYGYSIDPHKAGALWDIYGTAGIRFYI